MKNKTKFNKGFTTQIIAVVIMAILVVGVIMYFDSKNRQENQDTSADEQLEILNATSTDADRAVTGVVTTPEISKPTPISSPGSVAVTSSSTASGKTFWAPFTDRLISPDELTFRISTDKKTYTQNEKIQITLTVSNNTSDSQILRFATSCQASYSIALMNDVSKIEFDSKTNSACSAYENSITIPAKATKQLKLTHDPIVYRLSVGKHAVTGTVIGYGDSSISINVTQ